jgi:hypothetical protein
MSISNAISSGFLGFYSAFKSTKMKGDLKLYPMAKAIWAEIHFPGGSLGVGGSPAGGNPFR